MLKPSRSGSLIARVLVRVIVLSCAAPWNASAVCPHSPGSAPARSPAIADADSEAWHVLGIADACREAGSYRAEGFYTDAVGLAPENPWVLEAIARYYRTYRGSRGLFAESEAYYLRAEAAVEKALEDARAGKRADLKDLLDIREQIVRGRVELNKQEGFGLFIPSQPGSKLGFYLGSQIEYGKVSFPHNDLATPARSMIVDPDAMLRKSDLFRHRNRLRIRYGRLPHLDVAWSDVNQTEALSVGWDPGAFEDIDIHELQIGLEDSMGLAPLGDVFWRLEWTRGDAYGVGDEHIDRITASTTLTRNFGRFKANLGLFGNFARVDVDPGPIDDDYTWAVNLQLLHYPVLATTEDRPINPRAYEYGLGVVRHTREFGDSVELVQDTFFAGLKRTEILPRTDIQFLANIFGNSIHGEPGRDSDDLELNLILTHRILDFVNEVQMHQTERRIGLAQWAVAARLFEDISLRELEDFESRGAVLSTFVEIFSASANRSTAIVEAAYELRDYHNLGKTEHFFRVVFRTSIRP